MRTEIFWSETERQEWFSFQNINNGWQTDDSNMRIKANPKVKFVSSNKSPFLNLTMFAELLLKLSLMSHRFQLQSQTKKLSIYILQWSQVFYESWIYESTKVFCLRSNTLLTQAIITRSCFETALDHKPRILRLGKVSCNTNHSAL